MPTEVSTKVPTEMPTEVPTETGQMSTFTARNCQVPAHILDVIQGVRNQIVQSIQSKIGKCQI